MINESLLSRGLSITDVKPHCGWVACLKDRGVFESFERENFSKKVLQQSGNIYTNLKVQERALNEETMSIMGELPD